MSDFRKELINMKTEIEEVKEEEKSLAMELLQDSKKQNKRSFILTIILIVALFLSNISWLLYINQFDFSTTTETTQEIMQEQTNVDNSNMQGVVN